MIGTVDLAGCWREDGEGPIRDGADGSFGVFRRSVTSRPVTSAACPATAAHLAAKLVGVQADEGGGDVR
jgi:hypothetical protein